MNKCDALRCRRIALKISREKVAQTAGINVKYVEYFEDGKNVGSHYEKKISNALFTLSKSLSNLDHYRFRIMELALKLDIETDKEVLTKQLAHLLVEAAKFQMDLADLNQFLHA